MPSKLPHDALGLSPIHLTYRLIGSLPKKIVDQILFRRDKRLSVLESEITNITHGDLPEIYKGKKFQIYAACELAIEDALHSLEKDGPRTLSIDRAAKVVLKSWEIYRSEAWYTFMLYAS